MKNSNRPARFRSAVMAGTRIVAGTGWDRIGGRVAALVIAASLLAGCGTTSPTPGAQGPAPGSPTPSRDASPTRSAPPSAPPSSTPSVPLPATASVAPSESPVGVVPWEPDPVLTPGATNPAVTQATIGTTICLPGWTATIRPPASYTTRLKTQQIVAYGYADTRTADYEEDHLISLEIGGAPRDPRNLWPEPYTASLPDGTAVGARAKDQLENYLHRQVCDGAMTLSRAQSLIVHDWVDAWKAAGLDPGVVSTPAVSPSSS